MTGALTFQSTILLNPQQLEDIIRKAVEGNVQLPMKITKFTFKIQDCTRGIGHGKSEWSEFVGAELEVEITDTKP